MKRATLVIGLVALAAILAGCSNNPTNPAGEASLSDSEQAQLAEAADGLGESLTEELSEHYSLSQSQTHFVLHRSQTWAPLEGASFYGGGIGSPTLFPVVDEGWYVCMYWTKESRPERGTKMIMRLPGTDRAVVVAAGYETGPGDLTNIAGTVEETHFYLGTSHHSTLTLGIATDQVLPFGPRTCTD